VIFLFLIGRTVWKSEQGDFRTAFGLMNADVKKSTESCHSVHLHLHFLATPGPARPAVHRKCLGCDKGVGVGPEEQSAFLSWKPPRSRRSQPAASHLWCPRAGRPAPHCRRVTRTPCYGLRSHWQCVRRWSITSGPGWHGSPGPARRLLPGSGGSGWGP
jgi:hypothetical protein